MDQQYNGKDGLDAVNQNKTDLVILDLLMPVMNGEEFLKNFRHVLNIKDVPVIICSVNQTLAHVCPMLAQHGPRNAHKGTHVSEQGSLSLILSLLNLILTKKSEYLKKLS